MTFKNKQFHHKRISYEIDSTNHIETDPMTNFEKKNQIITDIEGLLHSPELHNKIL